MAQVRAPRSRRVVSARTIALLRPILRRSEQRQAWILRVIGGRVGPVLLSEDDQLTLKGPDGWVTSPVPHHLKVGTQRPTDDPMPTAGTVR